MMILQSEPLNNLDCHDVDLELSKPLANTHPGTMREDDVSIGVSRVVLWTPTQPSLRLKLVRISPLLGVSHGVLEEITDNGVLGNLITLQHHVRLSSPGHAQDGRI